MRLITRLEAEFQFTRPRGARRVPAGTDARAVVSIHAPTGGATCVVAIIDANARVSIHAPTGGATGGGHVVLRRLIVSIHAPTGGATATAKDFNEATQFQFTRPRGARQRRVRNAARVASFNSRAHGGRDPAGI